LDVALNADSSSNGSGWIRVYGKIVSNGGAIVMAGTFDSLSLTFRPAVGDGFQGAGVWLHGATIDSGNGNITIVGRGDGGNSGNDGVLIDAGAKLTAVDGLISIKGFGGGGFGSLNRGVAIVGATVETTGSSASTNAGLIGITGTGGGGFDGLNHGVVLDNAVVRTAIGRISITGTGG
ncbi:unnamed protein product, partial [Phaeothamnion confervicola]